MISKKPVTIISGFLGAGKTTFLNRIIHQHPKVKFAIIENELGAINIDSQLVINNQDGSIYELSNGCICCSVNGEFSEILKDLVLSDLEFDHLLIETTGIAHPTSIAEVFVNNPLIKESFYIDSIITLVDVLNFMQNITNCEETVRQVATADTIIINKIDDSSESNLRQVEQYISKINPTAIRHKTSYGKLDTTPLLKIKAFSQDKAEKDTLMFFPVQQTIEKQSVVEVKTNQHQIQAHHMLISEPFDPQKFEFWMKYYLKFNQDKLFRAKGILHFKDEPQKIIFQAVQGSYSIDEGDYWVNEEKTTKIVFIGKELDEEEIKKNLAQLLAE